MMTYALFLVYLFYTFHCAKNSDNAAADAHNQANQIHTKTNCDCIKIDVMEQEIVHLKNLLNIVLNQSHEVSKQVIGISTKQRIFESYLLQYSGLWKELKESEMSLRLKQYRLQNQQDNQSAILHKIENQQTSISRKQNKMEDLVKVQSSKINETKTEASQKHKFLSTEQKQLADELVNHTTLVENRLQNINKTIQETGNKIHNSFYDLESKFNNYQHSLSNQTNNQALLIYKLQHTCAEAKATGDKLEIHYRNFVLKQQAMDLKVQGHDALISQLDEKLPTYYQVVWTGINDHTDAGTIKSITYTKQYEASGLRVSYYGNNRVMTTSGYRCSRWYFTFNGSECSNPTKIDASIVTRDKDTDMIRPTVVTGICYGIPKGSTKIDFNIGACPSYPLGDGHTGWVTSLRIIVEEVEGLQ